MHIAFYAPMKPPDHPVPSGDRRMAQLLIQALRCAGHRIALASRLRSYDGTGDAATQRRVRTAGRRLAARYAARYAERQRNDPPDLWFTYHCYHKAPDHLGPAVADALDIPYVIADASVAPKQAHGPWADGFAAANAAICRADRSTFPASLRCAATGVESSACRRWWTAASSRPTPSPGAISRKRSISTRHAPGSSRRQ
jgi:hypothetical protein